MDITRRLLTVGQLARVLGVPSRKIESWCEPLEREGKARRPPLLTPSIPATGTGSRRRFAWPEVIKAGILVELHRLLGTKLVLQFALPLLVLEKHDRAWKPFVALPGVDPLYIGIQASPGGSPGATAGSWHWNYERKRDWKPNRVDKLDELTLVINVDKIKAKIVEALEE